MICCSAKWAGGPRRAGEQLNPGRVGCEAVVMAVEAMARYSFRQRGDLHVWFSSEPWELTSSFRWPCAQTVVLMGRAERSTRKSFLAGGCHGDGIDEAEQEGHKGFCLPPNNTPVRGFPL